MPAPLPSLQVTGLGVSARHPYLFSCGLDKMVKCWDLEQNKAGACCMKQSQGHRSACLVVLAFHTAKLRDM